MNRRTVYATSQVPADAREKTDTRSSQAALNIRAALTVRGTSLGAWAQANGYGRRMVYMVVERWAHRIDREPHGAISQEIMRRLREDLGADVVPMPRMVEVRS